MSDRRASWLMWFGVWAAPAAWALQHAAGVMFGLAQCNPNGRRWQIPLGTWDVAVAIVCALIGSVRLRPSLKLWPTAVALAKAVSRTASDDASVIGQCGW